jgi:hypothetical protein
VEAFLPVGGQVDSHGVRVNIPTQDAFSCAEGSIPFLYFGFRDHGAPHRVWGVLNNRVDVM